MLHLQQKTQGTPHISQQSNIRPHQERQEPTVASKGDQLGTITKGAPHGTITKGALHEWQHMQEKIAHWTRAKNSKPSQHDTNPTASHTPWQRTALSSQMMTQQAIACLVIKKERGEYMMCAQL